MRVHLVHGIHTAFGDPMVGELVPFLHEAGFEVKYPDYGWEAGLATKIINPYIVRSILPYIEPGDLFIGHSNGCAIGYDLMQHDAPIAGAVFLNAALAQHITRLSPCNWIDVYSNSGDQITEAAKIAQRIGLVDPVWGEMGHAGYLGDDAAIKNYYCDKIEGMPIALGHSALFLPTNIELWGRFIVNRIKERY